MLHLPSVPNPSQLAQINSALASANQDFLATRYQDALTTYSQVEALLVPFFPTQSNEFVTDPSVDMLGYQLDTGRINCYVALGQYDHAVTEISAALADYVPNPATADSDAVVLWARFATLYLESGKGHYRAGDMGTARFMFRNIVEINFTSTQAAKGISPFLFSTNSKLAAGVTAALQVISSLDSANLGKLTAITVNPVLAAPIVEAWQHLYKIMHGLDFWGLSSLSIPIWTFEYLQSLAVNFTQSAISAERDYINFQNQAAQGALSRQQLVQNMAQANAQVQLSMAQANAAQAEVKTYSDGAAVASQRQADAQANANNYSNQAWQWAISSALSTQVQGGDGTDPAAIESFMGALLSNNSVIEPLGEGGATAAAAYQLIAAKAQKDYQVAMLQQQAQELATAATQAADELTAANAKATAAAVAVNVANLQAQAAIKSLNAFDSQPFSPTDWSLMSTAVYQLYRRYLDMALVTALLMQKAYNFETDQQVQFIKSDYSSNEIKGLLAADALMADIQNFSYDLITSNAGKPQPVRQSISLATRYPYVFESQFRKTGVMEFETAIEDFDFLYPGAYAGRIASIEVEVDGLVPPRGLSGTLTNNGISTYRVPSSAWFSQATVATTVPLAAYQYNNGTNGRGATITFTAVGALTLDGNAVTAKDVILVANETAEKAPNNGLYTCTVTGTATAAAVLTRSTDMNQAIDFSGAVVLVMQGTENGNSRWKCTNQGPVQLGTTSITFAKAAATPSFSGGSSNKIWPSGLKRRVQPSETLVLSDYSARQDDPLIPPNPNMLKVFQGAGVASSWRLEIPRSVNDVDFGTLTDVRLTFYYWARFDPDLRGRVLAHLAAVDHFNARQQALPLRWVYPDAFFLFQRTGQLSVTLGIRDFPLNVTNPQLTNIGILVTTDKTVLPSGITVSFATPTHTAVAGASDANGQILSKTKDATGKDIAGPYATLVPAPVLGTYTLSVTAASNPGLVSNGILNLQPIINLGILLEYTFTPRT